MTSEPYPAGAWQWRSTTLADLSAIQTIARAVHPTLGERAEVFANKLSLFPEGCFVLSSEREVVGYAIVHPWRSNDIPKLDTLLSRLPSLPDCLLIHDVALLEQARGRGAAKILVKLVNQIGKERGIAKLALVSVYNSHLQWARLGFEIVRNDKLAKQLEYYGAEARYMIRFAQEATSTG